jgi:hypothetical protein
LRQKTPGQCDDHTETGKGSLPNGIVGRRVFHDEGPAWAKAQASLKNGGSTSMHKGKSWQPGEVATGNESDNIHWDNVFQVLFLLGPEGFI